ncbi:MAG: SDR family oxidoreductase [Acidobacteria bacterium]|nr:SDR family oxidoreductase [Acidobacteriota bacterium]
MKLENKVAIVTGGGTGIGKGISRSLAEAGAVVVIAQSMLEKAEKAAAELRAEGHNVIPLEADISSREMVKKLVADTIDRCGAIDILVNNAAMTGPKVSEHFLDVTDELLDRTIDVNLKGTFIVSQEAARSMAGRGGSIIHISSVGAYAAQEGASVYCAAKSALTGLTKAMALELAPHGIRVNAIAPGDIRTETSENVVQDKKERGFSGNYVRKIPLNRRGEAFEIGPTAVFLASDDSSYITGETIVVDGGFLIY